VHALILEPKVPRGAAAKPEELGRYVATRFATFEFARASYQPGRLSREQAISRANKLGATLVVESELLGSGPSSALAMRIIEVKSGKPIYREQQVVSGTDSFGAAETMLAAIKTALPERLSPTEGGSGVPSDGGGPAVAGKK
jgi:hypothetical protein